MKSLRHLSHTSLSSLRIMGYLRLLVAEFCAAVEYVNEETFHALPGMGRWDTGTGALCCTHILNVCRQ